MNELVKTIQLNKILNTDESLETGLENISKIKITNGEEYNLIQERLKELKKEFKTFMTPHQETKKELYTPYKEIQTKISTIEKKFKQIEGGIKTVVSTYLLEQEKIQQELIAKQKEEEKKNETFEEIRLEEVEVKIEPTPKKFGMREFIDYEIEVLDKNKIPTQFLVVDEKAIINWVKENKTNGIEVKVEGVEIKQTKRFG